MIGVLHGYFLEGSGSNLWTRAMVRALCREGHTVHLVCQEGHPEAYDFIAEAYRYHANGEVETFLQRLVPYAGRAVLHKPQIGDLLPVYVGDRYEEFSRVVKMADLSDRELEQYLEANVRVVKRVIADHDVRVLHANHAVLMPTVAERACAPSGIPFAVMPHGSAIEYAVKQDPRMHRLAADALAAASRVFVIGPELRERVCTVFSGVRGLEARLERLSLGVDTSLFEPLERHARGERVAALCRGMRGLRRGRPSREPRWQRLLAGPADRATLLATLRSDADYWAKAPDTEAEEQLCRVDWEQDRIVLFVGRLIAAKGLQAVIAAMPLILQVVPRARLVVAGHGPLREGAQALVHSLASGRRDWVELLVAAGAALEGDSARPLCELGHLLEGLERSGSLDDYLVSAQLLDDRVVFVGYLAHEQLRHLFACSDVAVFPSVVAEAGPLVFLEALASSCFPIGTYHAGMAASIDAVAEELPPRAIDAMKLRPDPEHLAADIAKRVPEALAVADAHRATLRQIALDRYDWQSVARCWYEAMHP